MTKGQSETKQLLRAIERYHTAMQQAWEHLFPEIQRFIEAEGNAWTDFHDNTEEIEHGEAEESQRNQ